MPKITTVWHAGDLLLGIYAYKKDPSPLNGIRLIFALIGLTGNLFLPKEK